ncbi:MAG: hypothetical protein HC892_19715 [Saprospiraceae bacterium]|nr:hypothetical protein [Saprospiraceae bacterium]
MKILYLSLSNFFRKEYCFFYDKIEYFQKVGDSLIALGVKRGDFWGSPRMDTLVPEQKKSYAISNEEIERLFEERKEASFIQLFFPFKIKKVDNNPREEIFKILLGYDFTKNKIFQESYTVPDGKMKYKIPSDLYSEDRE